MQVSILGRRWQVTFCRLPKERDGSQQLGDCSDPSNPGKEIRLHKSQNDREMLETVIHESLHAAGWHLDHEFVEQFSEDAATFLWRLGYRRTTDGR